MEVIVCSGEKQIGAVAADLIAQVIAIKSNSVLGVATGSSPVDIYVELGRRVANQELSLRGCRAFMLDEYVGLPAEHPQRYHTFIEREFVDRTDIKSENVHGPDGLADDIPAACQAYEQAITAAGGIDIQILGIGSDGHIAFNEPGSSLGSRTRIKTLTEQTRIDNARFFGGNIDDVPRHCLTQGIATIMDARRIVLVATGRHKAEAIHQLVEGPISAMWPATALQYHPHVTVILDDAAASRLQLRSYYESTYANKPEWQFSTTS